MKKVRLGYYWFNRVKSRIYLQWIFLSSCQSGARKNLRALLLRLKIKRRSADEFLCLNFDIEFGRLLDLFFGLLI